jgi:hypothetical protein
MYGSLQIMYENNTPREPIDYKTVNIGATITNVAKDYILELAKHETMETGIKHTFSNVLNKIIMQHKKEHEQKGNNT